MCLATPGKIIEIKGEEAVVDFNGISKKVMISLTPQVKVGDYVIVHAGFSIQKLSQENAQELSKLFEQNQKHSHPH